MISSPQSAARSSRRAARGPARRPAVLVGLGMGALALTGCGPTIGINPGSAAVVGDRSLSMSKIDDTTSLYCKAYGPIIQQNAPDGLPLRLFRQQVASNLTQRLLGEQLAAQYDVQPSPEYAQQVATLRQQFTSGSTATRDAEIEVDAGGAFLQTVQVSIGKKLLEASGQANPTLNASLARGQVATQEWLQDHTIEVDPSLGVTFDPKTAKPSVADDQTSYPLSTLARQGAEANPTAAPDPGYVASLPASQVCHGAS